MHDYQFLRQQNENNETKKTRYFIHDDRIFENDIEEAKSSKNHILLEKNPFFRLFDVDKVWYGESTQPFSTMAKKQQEQKFICNIAYSDNKDFVLGNLNISLMNPLYLRYVFLNDYHPANNDRYTDIDLYNLPDDAGQFSGFNYTRVNHATLTPGDWIYIPGNWWVQIDQRMNEKFPGNSKPMYLKYLPDEDFETNSKWIEYEYTNMNNLADTAIMGLEEGYGS